MNIGYVCTNYNNSSFTGEAVRSLLANVSHNFSIVVVDNKSSDASIAELEHSVSAFPNVEVILNPDNVGYFRGLNIGIRRLRKIKPEIEILVVGNNDLVFPLDFGDAIEKNMETFRQHPVVSPNIITLDGIHQNPHVISRISKFREIIYDLYYANYYLASAIRKVAKLTARLTDRADETQHMVAQPIYQGHGAVYILGPIFFKHFTELWAPTFLMGEEFFLSKQLEEKQMQTFYEPSIVVSHRCHGAIESVPSRKMWQIAREAHKEYRKYVRILG